MAPDVSGAVAPAPVEPARFVSLPEPFLHALFGRLSTEDAKALRVTCSRAQAACASACRLPRLRATALLSEPPPPLSHLPPTIDLDFNARNADCGHRLLSALRQQSGRLGRRVRGVRLSGRDGLLSALQTLRLACPGLERLEIRCQHGYKGRHAECSDLGRCLQELECAFTGLKELHLTRLPISGPQLCGLCDSLGPGLRALSVRGLRHALTCESLSHLGRLGQLESLCVDHLRLQTRGFPAGPPLRSLELSDATVSTAGFASLNALTGLTRLALWGSGHRAALAFAPLPGLTALRRLHLEMALGDEVVAGLAECPALVVLSAQTARVSPQRGPATGHTVMAEGGGGAAAALCAGVDVVSAGDANADAEQAGGSEGLGLSVAVAAAGVLPLALTAVTRLSLESWEEGCAPLAAWLPGLRALTLEEGEGAWAAVAGHTALTALRMDAGGCLPPPEPGSAAAEAAAAELAAAGPEHGDGVEGKEEEGDEIAPLPIGHHHAHHHHHHHQGHSHYHRIRGADGSDGGGGGGGSDSDDEASVGGGGGSTASVSVSGTATDGTRSGCSTDSGAVAANGFANGGGGPSFRQRHSHTGGADGDGGAGDGGGSEEEAWWPPPPQLASLRLGGCEGWPEQAYGRCAPLPALTCLDLAGCQGLTAAALRRLLAAAPALRELALAGAPHLTDEALASLGGGVSAGVSDGGGSAGGDCGAGSSGNAGGLDTGDGAVAGMEEEEGVAEAEAEAGAEVALGVCAPAVAAAARGGRAATGVPVPPCAACADVAEAAVTCSISTSLADLALCTTTTTTTSITSHANGDVGDVTHGPGTNGSSPNGANVCAGRAMPRSTSAAALAAAAAAPWACAQEPAAAATAAAAALAAGAAAGLRRLELSRAPLITARGVAAAAAGLPDLTELRLDACRGVCREACVWLPQQLGRPSLSVVCAHDAVYDEH
ncbi:hypothetical protein HYH03_016687 [Edaphochlamys debaryana]|uniref:F-box domain-containing protein n=1 Tax=Edaphochlamys debaryana TaxID=47281 RepID=A0A835XJY2_9CHLO|nr:hypothetical protein HYH03_016687 [Edaphochlamys debaryana]|eukprot:KAG2484552.1 hypothetical protein HYH03_016687 [Edaphochlamys debaryana]